VSRYAEREVEFDTLHEVLAAGCRVLSKANEDNQGIKK
jgi:hypothetical protein